MTILFMKPKCLSLMFCVYIRALFLRIHKVDYCCACQTQTSFRLHQRVDFSCYYILILESRRNVVKLSPGIVIYLCMQPSYMGATYQNVSAVWPTIVFHITASEEEDLACIGTMVSGWGVVCISGETLPTFFYSGRIYECRKKYTSRNKFYHMPCPPLHALWYYHTMYALSVFNSIPNLGLNWLNWACVTLTPRKCQNTSWMGVKQQMSGCRRSGI